MRFSLRRFAKRSGRCAGLLAACVLSLGGAAAVTAPGSAGAAASECTVAYSVVNSWPGGFQGGITITNNGPAISSWTLAFMFPDAQQISGGWAATYTQNGQAVTAASLSWNGALGTGASTSIGFTGTVGATDAVPAYFTVNGYACNGAAQLPSVEMTSPAAGGSYAPGPASSWPPARASQPRRSARSSSSRPPRCPAPRTRRC